MATFRRNDDELVRCPYIAAHLVRKSRLQIHMVNCREHCIGEDKKICPFNATHCIPVEEFQEHLKICEDKAAVDKKVFETLKQSSSHFRGRTAVPSYSAFQIPHSEDWDQDSNSTDSTDDSNIKEECFKSESEQLQAKQNSGSSQGSDIFEENGTVHAKNKLSENLKRMNCMGMGRGQAMLASNHNPPCFSKNEDKTFIGRGRGFVSIPKGTTCSKEYNSSCSDEEVPIRCESVQSQNKSEKDSSSYSSNCSSPKSERSYTSQSKNNEKQILCRSTGIGRGHLLLEHSIVSTEPDGFHKPVDQVRCFKPQSEPSIGRARGFISSSQSHLLLEHSIESTEPDGFHKPVDQVRCFKPQNEPSIGRARGFISSSQRKEKLSNSRIAVDREAVQKMNKILTNRNSATNLKYDIEHLPPCLPGEIRSVPLLSE